MSITLTASSDFEKAGKQYVARITGRKPIATFARDFIGRRSGKRNDFTSALVVEPGLFEISSPTRKGAGREWVLVIEHEGELVKLQSDEEDAMKIAKRLDGRESLADIVAVESLARDAAWLVDHPNGPTHVFIYEIRTPGEAKKAVAAASESVAVDAIVAALAALPAPLQKKALATAKARLFPDPFAPQEIRRDRVAESTVDP